jgi:hypothetical protein
VFLLFFKLLTVFLPDGVNVKHENCIDSVAIFSLTVPPALAEAFGNFENCLLYSLQVTCMHIFDLDRECRPQTTRCRKFPGHSCGLILMVTANSTVACTRSVTHHQKVWQMGEGALSGRSILDS